MTFPVTYDACGRCESSKPGTVALWQETVALFPPAGTMGICNCRNARGGSSLSVHSCCRAWDCACRAPWGDRIAAFLVAMHRELGVQCVIWNRRIWSTTSPYWRVYTGVDPHTNHIHVELNRAAGSGLTRAIVRAAYNAWAGKRPPTATPLPEPIPAPRRRHMEVDELERPARKRPDAVNGHECWDTEARTHGTKWNLDGVESVVHSVLCVRPVRPTPEAKVTVYWPHAVATVSVPWGGSQWTVPVDGAIAVVDENDVGLNVHVEQIVLPR